MLETWHLDHNLVSTSNPSPIGHWPNLYCCLIRPLNGRLLRSDVTFTALRRTVLIFELLYCMYRHFNYMFVIRDVVCTEEVVRLTHSGETIGRYLMRIVC